MPAVLDAPAAVAPRRDAISVRAETLFRASVVIAVSPIVFSALRAVLRGWLPTGDDAAIAIRAHDVFSLHPPAVGPWSSASQWAHRDVALPGALQDYVLALPVRVFGLAAGTAFGMALVNAAALVAFAWLVRRRVGPVLACVALAFVATLSWSIGSEMLFDPWQPNACVFAFMLYLVAGWSIADGDLIGLPIAAFAGSYLIETHPSYVVLVPTVLLVAFAMLFWEMLAPPERHSDSTRVSPRRLGRFAFVSVAIAFVCWLPPLVQQITSSRGNLSALLDASSAPPPVRPSFHGALNAVGTLVALPRLWLPPTWATPPFNGAGGGRPFAAALIGLLIVGALLGAAWFDAARRRDRATVTLVGIAATALIAGIGTAYRSPSPYGLVGPYVRWLWAVSMFVWFALASCALRRPSQRVNAARAIAMVATAVIVLSAVFTLPTVDNHSGAPQWAATTAKRLVSHAAPSLKGVGSVVIIPDVSNAGFIVAPAVQAEFVDRGIPFRVADHGAILTLGNHRAANPGRDHDALWVTNGSVHEGARLIAFSSGLSRAESRELDALTGRVRTAMEQNGGVQLTDVGRFLVATSAPYFTDAWSAIAPIASDPAALIDAYGFTKIAAAQWNGQDVLDVGPVSRADLRRFTDLTNKRNDRTAALYLGPYNGEGS